MEPVKDHELYQGLESALGATVATGLMARLPPAPVDRLATKDDVAVVSGDLAALRTGMDARFAQVDQRFDKVDQRFDKVDERFDKVDERFDKVEVRLVALEVGLATIEGKSETRHAETLATIRGEMVSATLAQGRQLTIALIGALVAICTAAFFLSQLAG